MYHVRPMVEGDIDAVVSLGRHNWPQSRYDDMTFDRDGVSNFIHTVLGSNNVQIFVLTDNQGQVVGAIAGMCHKLPWFIEPVANETFFTILPDHRGYKQAMMLLRAYVGWAKMSGAKVINITADNHDDTDKRTSVLYERAGFKAASRTHSMKGY